MISPEWEIDNRQLWVWPWQRNRLNNERQIAWLHEQLAQKQRRCDELQEALIQLKQPSMKIQYERKPDGKLVSVQPKGWDAVRAARRENPPDEPEAIEGPFKTAAEPQEGAHDAVSS